jgi:D-apiose dehydrogenase
MAAKLRVGIVGAGWVSAYHLAAWRDCKVAEVVAIVDRDRRRAEARAQAFAIPCARQDVDEMLERDRLDALDIATPVETHADYCRRAAVHGLAILCQKPLAPTLDEARELVRAIGARGRLMVNENWRFRPHYRQVKRWTEDATGDVQQFHLAVRSSGLLPDEAGNLPALSRQPFLASLERLVIGELLIHHLDVARWLLGPLEVRGAVVRGGIVRGEHAAMILLQAQAGGLAVVAANMAAPGFPAAPIDALDLIGTRASVRLDASALMLSAPRAQHVRIDLAANYQQGFTDAAAHFANCVRHDRPFESDAADNLSTLALVDAAYRAIEAPS